MADRPPPGLKSIHTLREDRARGRYSRPSTTLLLVAVVGVSLTLVGYNAFANKSLESRRTALLEKQRAVQMTVGVEWDALRDRLEGAIADASAPYAGDFVDHGAPSVDFRTRPGLYLRMRLEDARSPGTLRAATEQSQRDGFAACFLHDTGAALGDAGPFGEQPWNLRRAYDSTKILTPRWIDDVKTTDDDLRMRAFEKQYDQAVREDIPLAVRIVKQSEYLLLVLDENGDDGPGAGGAAVSAAVSAAADGGPMTDSLVQATPHEARVELIDLKGSSGTTAKELTTRFRLRRSAESSYVMASESADLSPEMRLALQRQVNNCGLANAVTVALATK